MRILLLQHAPYVGAFGGAPKSNRMLLEALVEHGHSCRAVAPALRGGAEPVTATEHLGVELRAVARPQKVRGEAARQIEEFAPDRILVSSEDPGQLLLQTALAASRGTAERVLAIVQTTGNLPFGPASYLPNSRGTTLLRETSRIVVASGFLRSYFRRWAGIEVEVFHFPAYGHGPFPRLGRFDRGAVTLINPSPIKGIAIFLDLARTFRDTPFAAVPTWATSTADRAALAGEPNVEILRPAEDIDEIFRRVRVLLVPSLWQEAFGLVTVEAMLRGVPVMASDTGGLPEAKLGVDYVLPVRPIERFRFDQLDEIGMPSPEVPPQDLGPWSQALSTLLADRGRYEALSKASRQAALRFVRDIDVGRFAAILAGGA